MTMEFQIKLFNNLSDNNSFNLKIEQTESDTSSYEILKNSLENLFDIRDESFVILSKNGVKINHKSLIQDGQILQVCPKVLGGKVS